MNIIRVIFLFLIPLGTLPASPPNVVIVITDDQGYGDLSVHGNPVLETPALDALHGESIHLTDYHVSPTCAPTRGALMSGHYTNRAGPWHTIMGRSFLSTDSTTLAEVFQENGYRTGHFGKWHLGDNYPFRPEDRGFEEVLRHGGGGVGQTPDVWDNAYFNDTYYLNGEPVTYDGYCTDIFFNEAVRFIQESATSEKPFFAYITTNAPHGPFHVEEKYWKPYLEQGLTEQEAVFFGMITNIDENVAKLRAFLKEEGLAENTIFIFTTDNGTATGENVFNAGMRGKKNSSYDGGHRVPFFLNWPAAGLSEGRDIGTLSAHIDVLPTLIELCGLKSPHDYAFDGRSLAPLIFELPVAWPDRTIVTDSQRVYSPIKWRKSATMTQRWRLINGEELYDMENDPGQETDVSANYPDVVARLRANYDAWWKSVSTDFSKENRIIIGNPAENPVHLTCHDWFTTEEVTPWNQKHIREGVKWDGYWHLKTDSAGRYQVALSRWPAEINHPIRAGLPPGDAVPGLEAFRETPGRAMDIDKAVLTVDGRRWEQKVDDSMTKAVFEVDLPAGEIELHGQFIMQDQKVAGAYYATVERLKTRPNVVNQPTGQP